NTFRSNDNGEYILCLHSSLSSSKQWNRFALGASASYHVVASDLCGYGSSPIGKYLNGAMSLDDEIDLLVPVLKTLSGPIHLVGHSYGAAVAIKLAMAFPERFSSLTVYEPVLFSLLFSNPNTQQMAGEVMRVMSNIQIDCRLGQTNEATRKFIDFWSGSGTWNQFPGERQTEMSARIEVVLSNFRALLAEQDTLQKLGELNIPTLCLYGLQSPSLSIKISKMLGKIMPDIRLQSQVDMGHMGPITHGQQIDQLITDFIHLNSDNGHDMAA
ncbi:MAG: alpha/beta hydrolase, partial [Gammaproteobacteria bacterium]|nr:alpha/beta hydrolase [Gammaproteobacteria bacterium]